jgi:hypothetical protein
VSSLTHLRYSLYSQCHPQRVADSPFANLELYIQLLAIKSFHLQEDFDQAGPRDPCESYAAECKPWRAQTCDADVVSEPVPPEQPTRHSYQVDVGIGHGFRSRSEGCTEAPEAGVPQDLMQWENVDAGETLHACALVKLGSRDRDRSLVRVALWVLFRSQGWRA